MSGEPVDPPLSRSSFSGVVVRAIGMALGLATSIFLARTLAANDLGAYQGLLSICIILGGLASATAERTATRRIAALDRNDRAGVSDEVATAHTIVAITTLAVVVTLIAASLIPAVSDSARATMLIAALVTPGVAILLLRQWIALPLQGVAASLGPEQIGQPLLFLGAATIVAERSGLGPFQALVLYSAAGWIVWLVASQRSGLLSLLWTGLRAQPGGQDPSHHLRARFREGRPFVMMTAVGVLPVYAMVPIVGALLGLADAGRLAIALQFSGLVAMPLQIVSLSTMPRCAALDQQGKTKAIDALVRHAATLSIAGGVALAAVLLVGMAPLLDLLGPTFASTSELIVILVVGQLVNAALGPNGPTLQMMGYERDVVFVETVSTVIRLAAVAWTASAGDIVGVAFAIAMTTALRNVLLSATLYRRTGILSLPQVPHRRVAHH